MSDHSGNGVLPVVRTLDGGTLVRRDAEGAERPIAEFEESLVGRPRIEILREDAAGRVVARTYRYVGEPEQTDVEPEHLSDELLVHGPARAGKSDDEIVHGICDRARVDEVTARRILRRARALGRV